MTDTTAPEGYERIEWTEVRAGDVLMHYNGDRLTVKAVEYEMEMPPTISAVNLRLYSEGWERSGFAPYRKQPELPNEPGAYLDKDGNVWLRDDDWDGKPWIGQGYSDWLTPEEISQRAPFTRLVPMPTEDAVHAAVYNALRGSAVDGMYPLRTINAVMALLGGGDDD